MKVYVSELPKKCEDCPCCSGDQYCNYMWENYTDTEKPHFDECNLKDYCKVPYDFNNNMTKYKEWLDNLPKNNNEQYKTCPLQSLSDHDKQVRKEVCEEIRRLMESKTGIMIGRYNHQTLKHDEVKIIALEDLTEILEQIQSKDS